MNKISKNEIKFCDYKNNAKMKTVIFLKNKNMPMIFKSI